jgi:MarR family 2-MHQ and catechol resistance regulon transcriptional repressor
MGTHYRGRPTEVQALNAYIKLMRASDSVAAALERRLARLGLTEGQLGVLEVLLHLGPRSQREIGHRLFRSDGNVVMVLDNLERRGLVRRQRDREDRRRVIVRLTPEGRRLIDRVFPGHVAAIVAIFSVLSSAEREQLGRLCKTLGLHARPKASGAAVGHHPAAMEPARGASSPS